MPFGPATGRRAPPLVALAALVALAVAVAACGGAGARPSTPASAGAAPAASAPSPARAPSPSSSPSAPSPARPTSVLPAGPCGFPGYLEYSEGCDGSPPPTHAVVLADLADRDTAERLVARHTGALAPGYPYVLTADELPLADAGSAGPPRGASVGASRRANLFGDGPAPPPRPARGARFRVVAGLYADAGAAATLARALAAEVRAVSGPPAGPGEGDYQEYMRATRAAVLVVHPAPAWADADVVRETTGARGDDGRWMARVRPACEVRAGQLFDADLATVFSQGRELAPVECGGRRAWVAWTATRLESVVRVEADGPMIHQVVDVMCDMATIEREPYRFGAPLAARPRARATCGRSRS